MTQNSCVLPNSIFLDSPEISPLFPGDFQKKVTSHDMKIIMILLNGVIRKKQDSVLKDIIINAWRYECSHEIIAVIYRYTSCHMKHDEVWNNGINQYYSRLNSENLPAKDILIGLINK